MDQLPVLKAISRCVTSAVVDIPGEDPPLVLDFETMDQAFLNRYIDW